MQRTFQIGEFQLEHPIMVAAGMVKNPAGAKIAISNLTSALVAGSFTIGPRDGNPSPNDYLEEDGRLRVLFSLNSLGLPNPGIDSAELEALDALADAAGIPFVVSVAGETPEEYFSLVEKAFERGADIVELNLGCPNVWDGGKQKGIASYSPQAIQDVLECVTSEFGGGLAVKISPLANPTLVEEVAAVLWMHQLHLEYVASCNTYPNGFAWSVDGNKPAIGVGAGLAGVGGYTLKPISLGQIVRLREILKDEVQIVGVGGISSVLDVHDYLRAGASAVQVATDYYANPANLYHLVNEFAETNS